MRAPRGPCAAAYNISRIIAIKHYNLSDEQTEYQINDRLSFQKFLGLTLSDSVPDQKTIWLFREGLIRRGQVKSLFRRFEQHLHEAGLMGREGKMIDASFVDVPRQRNSREENKEIKEGTVPESFQQNENRRAQKDMAARWAKKGAEVHYGYKNHVKADRTTKLIEDYEVTDASVHDSQAVEDLVEAGDGIVYADSAYTGAAIETILEEHGVTGEICEKGYRNHPLTKAQKKRNQKKSKIRARVEHVFGFMTNTMKDGLKMRWIGMPRITGGIGLLNLVYNLARFEQILRLKLA
ncbi:MAG TPA: IS5 family transposase [Gammaproteobacteria bacterium]|nr:IS5 family transposase [Gammaproteobacteria bacterium]